MTTQLPYAGITIDGIVHHAYKSIKLKDAGRPFLWIEAGGKVSEMYSDYKEMYNDCKGNTVKWMPDTESKG